MNGSSSAPLDSAVKAAVNGGDSEEDMDEEFLYLLRINDLENAVKLLESMAVKNLNYRNEDGNTALHFVCANNLEIPTLFLLKTCKVDYQVFNRNGNSPLQWAVQNKCLNSLKILLAHDYEVHRNLDSYRNYVPTVSLSNMEVNVKLSDSVSDHYNIRDYRKNYADENVIDIMRKNEFGKSVLSEAFNSENLDLLQLILEHPISASLDSFKATEEDVVNEGVDPDTMEVDAQNVVHEFQFIARGELAEGKPSSVIKIREVGIEDSKILNSVQSELDASGLIIWESSIISSFWVSKLVKCLDFSGKNVLELGSGCGLLGIAFQVACNFYGKKPGKLALSDCSQKTLDNLSYNLDLNRLEGVQLVQLNWKSFDVKEKYHVIIGSDLIYDKNLAEPLANAVNQLLENDGQFFYTYKVSRDGADVFLERLTASGFTVEVEPVSREYQRNPFVDKTMEYCLSFFPDLESDDYMFLRALRKPDV